MIDTWFTSDTHFFHKNILEYEKEARPFSCLEEMHEIMIERWNSVVNSKDIVYHLGDFAFGKHNIAIAGRLNGKKKLVMGNHDNYPSHLYLEYFDKLYGATYWGRCVLSHIPIHPNCLASRWMLNVHGHLHHNKVKDIHGNEDRNYFNVSVEQNDMRPFHIDEIMQRVKEIS